MLTFLAQTTGINSTMAMLIQLVPLVLVFVIFYFMLIRPQKKRERQVADMRSKIEVGDEIVTVGGIIGLVVSLREDTVVIETGSDRSKVRIARWAIQQNNTVHDIAPVEA
ncbi:MAG: preprotein translocase subunit YajC [Oscillospiraceae bacterium]